MGKNGKERTVRVKKLPRFYPTEEKPRKLQNYAAKSRKSVVFHKLRKTLTPGTVCILLAGRHKGKRVVLMKQLASGLLLVNGPYHLNGCPLRRINQRYVIATNTKFNIKKEVYSVSEERKEDQKSVDSQLLDVIRKHPKKKLMFGYLGAMFSLSNSQYPHKMVF